MPKFHIERSIDINAPAHQARAVIQDYQQWEIWSPWLCMEPTASLEIEGTAATPGHAYSWTGDMVGAGRMELSAIDGESDLMDLTFIKPFKSTAKVKFVTTAIDAGKTRVTWHMDSGLPIFLFFMIGTMKAMIGMDYERGLKLLKEYVETGTVTSHTEIVGEVNAPTTHYAGVSAESQLQSLSQSMQQTFPKVMALVEDKSTLTEGKATKATRGAMCGAIYHRMDIKSQRCEYTAFASVDEDDATGSIPDCRALKVIHTGSYHHLGNAWSTVNSYQRHRKLKLNKQVAPFEFYMNDPEKVASKDLVTEIYLPIKS